MGPFFGRFRTVDLDIFFKNAESTRVSMLYAVEQAYHRRHNRNLPTSLWVLD